MMALSVVFLVEKLFTRRSVSLSGAAVFGSLAMLSTLVIPARIQPAFPILPFLRFDPAEIFSALAFLIFGPIPALLATTVHWIFLNLTSSGSTGFLGPMVKFASVLSTLLGLWLGSILYQRIANANPRASVALGSMLGCAVMFRIGVTLVVNYFVFTYVGPVIFNVKYLELGQMTLQATLGLHFAGPLEILMAMLLYTSIFNGLHATFSVMIPYFVFTPLSLRIPEIASGHPWISRFTNK